MTLTAKQDWGEVWTETLTTVTQEEHGSVDFLIAEFQFLVCFRYPLSDTCFASIFFQSLTGLFDLSTVSFAEQDFLIKKIFFN